MKNPFLDFEKIQQLEVRMRTLGASKPQNGTQEPRQIHPGKIEIEAKLVEDLLNNKVKTPERLSESKISNKTMNPITDDMNIHFEKEIKLESSENIEDCEKIRPKSNFSDLKSSQSKPSIASSLPGPEDVKKKRDRDVAYENEGFLLQSEKLKKNKVDQNVLSDEETHQSYDISANQRDTSISNQDSHKITDFFKKRNGEAGTNNSQSLINFNQKSKLLKEKSNSNIIEEVPVKWLEEKQKFLEKIKEYENKFEQMNKELERKETFWESRVNTLESDLKTLKNKARNIISKQSVENEYHKRMERKNTLNQQKQRLGEYVSQREGNKFVEVWIDGFDVKKLKEKLNTILAEKEELEKIKKNLKSKKLPSKQGNPNDPSTAQNEKESTDTANTETKEMKERINARQTMLSREENFVREKLEQLETEKIIFYQQFKRQYEEDHSRYGKSNSDVNPTAWPILADKYQLLALLGKGGFSEVYKAYDLEDFQVVACKIHQLNPNWTESAKANYVKHATREFEVQKDLNHPNIVKLFDSLSIDENTFSTILEYCEGPDLSSYLKEYKQLPEKDARIIIKQILSALYYLNEQKTKIIHYDLKPQNVLFHKGEIKISDFGLCKIFDNETSRMELTSQGVGTYWYLPPECFVVDDKPPLISNKVDVWSVGVMFYEMVYGQKPFGNNMSQEKILKEQVILKSNTVAFPNKPNLSNEAKEFIKKCLAHNQEERYDVSQAYNSLYINKK